MTNKKYHGVYALDLFMRNEPRSWLGLVVLMASEPQVGDAVKLCIKNAKEGACTKDCGPCGKPIKSIAELAGFAYFHGRDDRNNESTVLLSPVCETCSSLGADIVITRYSELLKKKLFGGELEVVLPPEETPETGLK